jgi:hypothetical protein
MLTSVSGIYDHGKIILDEVPPVKIKSKIVITFLEEIPDTPATKRRLGTLKGKIGIPNDFNEPIDDLNDYMF